MMFMIFVVVLFLQLLFNSLFISLVYYRHKKREQNVFDYRKPVLLYIFLSNSIGLFFTAFIGTDKIFISNSFESYFYPCLGFFISLALSLIILNFVVFKSQREYLYDMIMILILCAPYIVFLPIIINLFVCIGVCSPIQ